MPVRWWRRCYKYVPSCIQPGRQALGRHHAELPLAVVGQRLAALHTCQDAAEMLRGNAQRTWIGAVQAVSCIKAAGKKNSQKHPENKKQLSPDG